MPGQQEPLDLLHRGEGARRIDSDELRTDLHASRIGHDVLFLQPIDDHRGMNAELRHAVPVRLHIDGFVALAPQLDLGHVLHKKQLAPQELGDLLQLGVAVLIAVKSDEDAPDIPVVVVDDGGTSPRRQGLLNIADLAA